MNRSLRRAEARASRRKQSPCRSVTLHKAMDEWHVFNPVTRILDQIALGELEFANGVPTCTSAAGNWIEILPALEGWITCRRRIGDKFGRDIDLSGLITVHDKLASDELLTHADLDAANIAIQSQRQAFRTLPRGALAEVAKEQKIIFYMEESRGA